MKLDVYGLCAEYGLDIERLSVEQAIDVGAWLEAYNRGLVTRGEMEEKVVWILRDLIPAEHFFRVYPEYRPAEPPAYR